MRFSRLEYTPVLGGSPFVQREGQASNFAVVNQTTVKISCTNCCKTLGGAVNFYLCALASQAAKSGVPPLWSLTSTSAPNCNSCRTPTMFRLDAAVCNGILQKNILSRSKPPPGTRFDRKTIPKFYIKRRSWSNQSAGCRTQRRIVVISDRQYPLQTCHLRRDNRPKHHTHAPTLSPLSNLSPFSSSKPRTCAGNDRVSQSRYVRSAPLSPATSSTGEDLEIAPFQKHSFPT